MVPMVIYTLFLFSLKYTSEEEAVKGEHLVLIEIFVKFMINSKYYFTFSGGFD